MTLGGETPISQGDCLHRVAQVVGCRDLQTGFAEEMQEDSLIWMLRWQKTSQGRVHRLKKQGQSTRWAVLWKQLRLMRKLHANAVSSYNQHTRNSFGGPNAQ